MFDDGGGRYGVISAQKAARRIGGVGPISITGNPDSMTGEVIDLRIAFNMNLTGLTKCYIKQDSDNKLDSKFEHVSRIHAFKCPYYIATAYTYHKLGRLNLPNGGHHAVMSTSACRGWGTTVEGLENSSGNNIPNYQMTAHIYSSTNNTSRVVFPRSLGNR